MRITNGMMVNNSLTNINRNKTKMDELNTQLMSEKKIQRPSEDPIVAIRALRFRSTLSEIEQYTNRNIKDAESWLAVTDDAMGNVVKILGDITTYCNQAVNGYYDTTNKKTIVETLKAFRDQIYSDANTDCAGRTIFTGYKTDTTLTFIGDEPSKSFEITEKFTPEKFDSIRKINNSVDISGITVANVGTFDTSTIEIPGYTDAYRIRLAYDNLDNTGTPSVSYYNLDADGNRTDEGTQTVNTVSVNNPNAYMPGDDEVNFIPETGEYIFGKNIYSKISTFDGFDITYTKTGFDRGELNPIHYFDCKDLADGKEYTAKEQPIRYEVNFNQTIQINVQGKDVFTHDMTRDLDDIIVAVNTVDEIENKIKSLQFMYDSCEENSDERKNLQALMDNCNRELDFAKDELENKFSTALTKYQEHQNTASLARADVGARETRLELISERLAAQKTTVESLKTANEEVDVAEVAVELKEASGVYDASLAAAAKVVQNKLMDFIN